MQVNTILRTDWQENTTTTSNTDTSTTKNLQ